LDIFLFYNKRTISVVSNSYILKYEIAIWLSIFILILLDITSLLPAFYPKKYRKYSIQEGSRSLITSILSFIYLLTFLLTALITYKIGNNVIVIRDTFPSYIPVISLYIFYIIFKAIDLFNFSRHKDFYNKIAKEEERKLRKTPVVPKDVNEFNKTIFTAINSITSEGLNPTLSKIRTYFVQNNISKVFNSNVKLNLNYLNSLVKSFFLESEEILNKKKAQPSQLFLIYTLTPKAEKLLEIDELESDEIYDLIEEVVSPDILIKCPNPKCNYYCQPTWENCPICNTLLDDHSKTISINRDFGKLKYCAICGIETNSKSSSVCINCQEQGFSDVREFNNCPACGELTIANSKFCIFCYHSFNNPSSKYDNYTLEQHYQLSIKYDKYFRFLLIIPIHFVIIFIFLQQIFQNYNIIILFDFNDSIILSLFFGILIIFTYYKRLHIRNERISRDLHHRILLAISRYKKGGRETSTESNFKLNQKKFRQENSEIKNFFVKFKGSKMIG